MNKLLDLRRLISDDAYAISFQTFGQYRTALLKAIDAALFEAAHYQEGRDLLPDGVPEGLKP